MNAITVRVTARPSLPMCERSRSEAGVDLSGGRILLLCYPRLLGYAFNPLSIYYGYRADGTLALLIYEVRNTFGEHHSYVCPVRPGEVSGRDIRQARDKRLYVSPVHRHGHALPFSPDHAGRRPENPHSGDRRGRPAPGCDIPWSTERP